MDRRQYLEEEQLTVLKEEFYWICQGNESQSNSGNGSYKHKFYNSLFLDCIYGYAMSGDKMSWLAEIVTYRPPMARLVNFKIL